MGVLEAYDVEMIGATAAGDRQGRGSRTVPRGDDQDRPRNAALASHQDAVPALSTRSTTSACPRSFGRASRWAAPAAASPTIEDEFIEIVERGIDASPTSEVLIEESVLGWKEFEMEVVRDKADNCIIVCSIENIDPMGVHTGDSITVAPALTLTDKEYQIMRDASLAVLREIGVETGGSNVQFAVNPGRWPHDRDRDESARFALLGARLQGDRLSHRQGRRQARGRLHARRNRQRHHGRRDARLVRADDRLYRHQNPALRVREIPRRRSCPDDCDEIGRRGDGDRPNLRRSRCRRRCVRWRRASPASTKSRSKGSARATTPTRCAPRSASRRPTGC